jgi:pimeloyl-ACP methyl ester carboxylesterase
VGELQVHFCTSADGTRIAFAIGGEGPPLLFITSWGATAAHHLSPWLRAWADRMSARRQFAIMDRRGTGASQREIASLSVESQLEDIAAAPRARSGAVSTSSPWPTPARWPWRSRPGTPSGSPGSFCGVRSRLAISWADRRSSPAPQI